MLMIIMEDVVIEKMGEEGVTTDCRMVRKRKKGRSEDFKKGFEIGQLHLVSKMEP